MDSTGLGREECCARFIMCYLYTHPHTYVPLEDPECVPFIKPLRNALVKGISAYLKNSLALIRNPGVIVGDAAIEMGSLI